MEGFLVNKNFVYTSHRNVEFSFLNPRIESSFSQQWKIFYAFIDEFINNYYGKLFDSSSNLMKAKFYSKGYGYN